MFSFQTTIITMDNGYVQKYIPIHIRYQGLKKYFDNTRINYICERMNEW
jgi:hypothetical protein